jgi:hypothetical protein
LYGLANAPFQKLFKKNLKEGHHIGKMISEKKNVLSLRVDLWNDAPMGIFIALAQTFSVRIKTRTFFPTDSPQQLVWGISVESMEFKSVAIQSTAYTRGKKVNENDRPAV